MILNVIERVQNGVVFVAAFFVARTQFLVVGVALQRLVLLLLGLVCRLRLGLWFRFWLRLGLNLVCLLSLLRLQNFCNDVFYRLLLLGLLARARAAGAWGRGLLFVVALIGAPHNAYNGANNQ